jgi:hypothetical protein
MFLRHTKRKKDGKTHCYWSIVENQRLDDGRVVQRHVLYLGEINSSQAAAWRGGDRHRHIFGRLHAQARVLHRALAPHRAPAEGAAGACPRAGRRPEPGDDRLELFIGGTKLTTLKRGRAVSSNKHGHVVDYHHVIHALRRKPMALLGLVYRDQLFPRDVYRRTFDRLLETLAEKPACRLMVDLLALAHDRGCEAELADILAACLDAHQLPDMAALRDRFTPDPSALPEIVVHLTPLSAYEALLGGGMGEAA